MLGWSLFILFVVALMAVAFLVILLRPDQYFTRKRRIVCPETRSPAGIEIDVTHAVKTLLAGVEDMRIKSCERWPGRADCDQECLLQVDTKPAVLERALQQFYAGKSCARCGHPLGKEDWWHGRFAMLNVKDEMVPAGRLPLKEFPMVLEQYRPICWPCHQTERAKQGLAPEVLFKGDRRGNHAPPWLD